MGEICLPQTVEEAIEFYQHFELDVRVNLTTEITGDNCPHCGFHPDEDTWFYYIRTRDIWRCQNCNRQFSERAKTVYYRSHLPYWKWFVGVWFVLRSKRPKPNSRELARILQIKQESAWWMIQKIKAALKTEPYQRWVAWENNGFLPES